MEQPWSSALVTGASSGIGEAIARELAGGGTNLVLVARRAERLSVLADDLRSKTGRSGRMVQVETLCADLTNPEDLTRIGQRVGASERPIDLLVNCAGLGQSGAFSDGDLDTYNRIIDLNIRALVDLTHAAASAMKSRRRGWILNVSSLGGHAPGPSFAVYSASKAFVTSFSESLHEELRPFGVSVTVTCPGATETAFADIAGVGMQDLPGLLVQSPEEVAVESLTALASGRAVRVTGTVNRVSAAVTTVLPRSVNRRLSTLVTNYL